MKKAVSIVIALSISLFIYLFYRSEKTVVNELIILIFSIDTYASIKGVITKSIPLNDQTVFSLPGGLWIFCVTALSREFYLRIKYRDMQVSFLPLIFAFGLELCQLIHLTNGRFDVWDLALYLLFWFLAYHCFKPRGSQENILSPFTLHSFICMACFLSVYLAHVSQ